MQPEEIGNVECTCHLRPTHPHWGGQEEEKRENVPFTSAMRPKFGSSGTLKELCDYSSL